MDNKWKFLVLVFLSLNCALEVSGQQGLPSCTICVEKKGEKKCEKTENFLICFRGIYFDQKNVELNESLKKFNFLKPIDRKTTSQPSVNNQEKLGQVYVEGQDFACAKYEGAPKDNPTGDIYTIYGCTTLTAHEKKNKHVTDARNCNTDKRIVKFNDIDFEVSECYCQPNWFQSCFVGGIATQLPVLLLPPGSLPSGPRPSYKPDDRPFLATTRGYNSFQTTGISGVQRRSGDVNEDKEKDGRGSNVRASVGLFLGAIGLFGFHQIQRVQPAL